MKANLSTTGVFWSSFVLGQLSWPCGLRTDTVELINMPFITQGKTNWKRILVEVILTTFFIIIFLTREFTLGIFILIFGLEIWLGIKKTMFLAKVGMGMVIVFFIVCAVFEMVYRGSVSNQINNLITQILFRGF